ncbi:hypothetical protein [Arundinibacter roseus]|uniref:hypothetical protein n=1 Tax=Arundinibacter roseus TaxID=2070510 RepID=UPI00140554FA|nr:hypothetical protein [Arundinibacter roseus]
MNWPVKNMNVRLTEQGRLAVEARRQTGFNFAQTDKFPKLYTFFTNLLTYQ